MAQVPTAAAPPPRDKLKLAARHSIGYRSVYASLDSMRHTGPEGIMREVPSAAPGLRIARYRAEIEQAQARVLDSGTYLLGPETAAFEAEFANYLGVEYALGVASGTDALILLLEAFGVGRDDEVLVPALSAPATVAAVLRLGARPRFVDVERTTRGMDPVLASQSINRRTKAVVVVHLHGVPAHVTELSAVASKHGLPLIEDCAQAHGARCGGRLVGTIGDAAAFSFYPTKNLGAMGDGGSIVTRCRDVADRVRRLRMYGFDGQGLCCGPGTNSRIDELQAAILRALLPHLDHGNSERRAFARFYYELLIEYGGQRGVNLPPWVEGSVYHQFAIEASDRDAFAEQLRRQGVGSAVHYRIPLHRHPYFASRAANAGDECPAAEALAATVLSLPIQPELRCHEQHIARALRNVVQDR